MYEFPCIRPMSKELIRQEAHLLWVKYVQVVGPEHVLNHGVDFNELYDALIYPQYEIELVRDQTLGLADDGSQILGEFLPKDNTALVDKSLYETGDHRFVFTVSHEVIGHGVLHGPFLREHAKEYATLLSTERSTGLTASGFDWSQMNTFEWQANAFAAHVIAPRTYVWCLWVKLFGTDRKMGYRGPGCYHLTFKDMSLPVKINSPFQLAWIIAKKMEHYFWGLSTQCIAYQVAAAVVDYRGYELGDKVPWGSARPLEQEAIGSFRA
jgi:hypothetical protein